MWSDVVTLFREYMGTGLIVGWFLLALAYLLVKEKKKPVRILFVYVPILLLLLFFNPLFAKLLYYFVGDEIYYRILWLIPITVVIAYALISLYSSLKGKKGLFFAAIGCVLIGISGSYIYKNPFFQKAENAYHMPQAVVDICDAIEVKGREVMAVFPSELIQYVRQYSPVIWMPYGREILVDRWGTYHELYEVMEAEVIEVKRLAALAKESHCHYVILAEDKTLNGGNMEDYDYELFGRMDGYVIYRDTTEYIGLGNPQEANTP